MDAVAILRQLWRYRLFVAVGMAVALLVGLLMSYQVTLGLPPKFENRQYEVGIASAAVLVDSPNSQVTDLGAGQNRADVGSLSARARLLANLMATSPLKDRIAARARLPSSILVALAPSEVPDAAPSPLDTGTTVRPTDPDANILNVQVNEALPIITANAQAPRAATAARISSAAVAELSLYLRQTAASESVPNVRQLIIKPLGVARSTTAERGPRRMVGAVVSAMLFAFWCVGILGVVGLARGWRQAAEVETLQARGEPAGIERLDSSLRGEHGLAALSSAPSPKWLARPERPARPERLDRPERPAWGTVTPRPARGRDDGDSGPATEAREHSSVASARSSRIV